MKLATLLALPALALSAALPVDSASSSTSSVDAASSTYKWNVTGWTAGCARSGCYYDFNVTGRAQAKSSSSSSAAAAPAFKAYCSGQQPWFRQCKLLSSGCANSKNNDSGCAVSARLFKDDKDPSNATIGISFAWTHYQDQFNSPRYNYTGFNRSTFNQFVAPAQTFYVTPTQLTAVD